MPALRTALLQLFDALRREPALTAAEVKNLLDWEELKARYAREGATSSLEEAVSATVDGWPLRRPAVQQEQRDAADRPPHADRAGALDHPPGVRPAHP